MGDNEPKPWALMRGLMSGEIEHVLSLGRTRLFGKREVVWHEGDRAETVHLIRSGRIAIRAMTSLGEMATVAVLGSGEVAGLVAVHGSEQFHTTGSVALEPTETIAVRAEDLTELRRRLPSVDEALVHFLADRALDLTAQLVEALYVPADARVMRRLAMLCTLYDRGEEEVMIPLTQEDLALLAGVTRP